jgi:hypothetical protein
MKGRGIFTVFGRLLPGIPSGSKTSLSRRFS